LKPEIIMAKQLPIEIFMPPNILKAKVGGSGKLDMSAIQRAEAAVEQMKDSFGGWIADDVNRLASARNTYAADPTPENFASLYRSAHDLKGQGTTFDFPMVARMASSLCHLTDTMENRAGTVPLNLVDAHVDAIKVLVRDNIRSSTDKMAGMLAGELERQVAAFLEKPAA